MNNFNNYVKQIKYFISSAIILTLISCGGNKSPLTDVNDTSSIDTINPFTDENDTSSIDTINPLIVLKGNQEIDLKIGNEYIEYGVDAFDNKDGNISHRVTIGGDSVNIQKAGTYTISYNVKDSAGNHAEEKNRIVNILNNIEKDIELPIITLNGSNQIELTVGDSYREYGAIVTDNVDTELITIGSGRVDTSTEGNYTVTYDVNDTAGNKAIQITRTIIVKAKPILNVKKPWAHGKLIRDAHMVKYEDGTGFFWMADTAWQLAQKLYSEEEVDFYLKNRKEKGFNVILVSIAEHTGIRRRETLVPAFNDYDWKQANNEYWTHVDYIVDKANALGLYIGILPAWHMFPDRNETKGLIDKDDAMHYGNYIATRYAGKKNIIWVVGGDSKADDSRVKEVWNALGTAIYNVASKKQLITYHPTGTVSSSKWFHGEDWLDFNMVQSGHCAPMNIGISNLRQDYKKIPTKPTLDGEPRYETMEECFYKDINISAGQGEGQRTGHRFNEKDVREIAYKQVFSGAFGHTYGHHSIWQMSLRKNNGPNIGGVQSTVNSWKEALDANGSTQMGYLVKLMKSRPMLSRVPDQSMVLNNDKTSFATRGDGYAFVYLPLGGSVTVNLSKISGDTIQVSWFNPRTGIVSEKETIGNNGSRTFNTPNSNDIVLILDDKSKNY